MSYPGRSIGSYMPQLGSEFSAAVPIEEAAKIQQQQEMQPIETELARYKLQGAQMETELAHATYENSMIANAARTAMDDPEKWDANFQALSDKGIAGARQFVGKYSPETADRVTSAYDMQSPLARASRPAQTAPASAEEYDRLYSRTDPSQFPQLADRAGKMLNLVDSVRDRQSYDAAKAAAVQMGIPGAQQMGPWNDFATPQIMREMHNHLVDQYAYLQKRIGGQATGEPSPLIPAKTEKLGDTLYSVDEQTPTGVATATPLAHEPKSTLVGYDRTGHPIYHDTTGGNPGEGPADTEGPYTIASPAKGSAGASTFNAKVQAGMAAGMNYPDAVQFANGRKAMSPEQVRGAAAKMAEADMHTEMMANGQIGDPNAYIQQHTAMWENELTQHSEQAQAAAVPPKGPVPKGMVRAPNGQTYTVQQATASAHAAMARARAAKDTHAQQVIIQRAKQMGINTQGL